MARGSEEDGRGRRRRRSRGSICSPGVVGSRRSLLLRLSRSALVISDSADFPIQLTKCLRYGVVYLSMDNAVSSVFGEAWNTIAMDSDDYIQLKKGSVVFQW